MTKKMISWLSVLTVFLTLLWSCHNEDFAKGETEPQRNNANFFKHTQKGGINAKSGVDYVSILEAYNREKDFLSTMPDQQGMPIWDKMQIVDTENATGLMIPLSHDNESMSSVLFAILDDKNSVTGVKDYDNNMLKNVVYNTTINKDFRERILYTFMYMDNRAFGNEKFTNIPEGLFDDLKYNKEYGRIEIKNFDEPKNATLNESGKILWVESCGTYWKCSHHGEGSCDYCMDKCHVQLCFSSMVFIEDGGYYPDASSGSSGGGGGATPSPEGIPPVDPCTQSGMPFYRMSPQCVGNGGGDMPILDDPCEKTKALLNDSDVQNKLDSLKDKSLSKGEIGFKTKKDGTVTGIISGGKHEVDLGVKAGYQGGYHNHTPKGIPMHSPPDIDNNLLAFARAQPTGEYKNAYFGMIVKKVCSSCPSGFKIYHYVIRFDGAYSDALTGFSQLDLDNFNIDYQNKEFDMTNPTGKYGTTYIDSTGQITNEGLEKLFFDTINAMNLTNKIILQRIEDSGIINNITLNHDGLHTTAIPCP